MAKGAKPTATHKANGKSSNKKSESSHISQSNLMVGEQNLEKSSPLYKKLLKLNDKDSKKASEPTILEMSSLSKVPPAVLEEKLNSEKVAEKKLQTKQLEVLSKEVEQAPAQLAQAQTKTKDEPDLYKDDTSKAESSAGDKNGKEFFDADLQVPEWPHYDDPISQKDEIKKELAEVTKQVNKWQALF